MEKRKKGHKEEDDGQPLFDLKKDPRKLEVPSLTNSITVVSLMT